MYHETGAPVVYNHIACRVKPCCSDQREAASALKSVYKCFVEATLPPSGDVLNANITRPVTHICVTMNLS